MAGLMDGIWDLSDALTLSPSATVSRSQATVTRIDNEGIVWIHIPGGVDETPVNGRATANVEPGDSVLVEIAGGRANIIGNSTSPSVSIREVERAVDPVIEHVETVESVANGAAAISEATNQHFWTDAQGVHVTHVTQEQFKRSPSGPNQLSNARGMLLRDGETYLSAFTTDGQYIYDGAGNEESNIAARFTADEAQLGYSSSPNVNITPDGTTFHGDKGSDIASILSTSTEEELKCSSHLFGTITCDISLTNPLVVELLYAPAFDKRNVSVLLYWVYNEQLYRHNFEFTEYGVNEYSHTDTGVELSVTLSDNNTLTITGFDANHAPITLVNDWDEGMGIPGCYYSYITMAKTPAFRFGDVQSTAPYSLAEGKGSTASGDYSHAEGSAQASGAYSHAEGKGSRASGDYAHAEGLTTSASGAYSHAEGSYSSATAADAHAEGSVTYASGMGSHAQNESTIAGKRAQTAIGRYNLEDTSTEVYGDYALIIGNGTSYSKRSNALTVDWDGNVACGTVNGVDISTIVSSGVYQGDVNSWETDLNDIAYKSGWYWTVATIGSYAGQQCEIGDLLFATKDRTNPVGRTPPTSDFTILQANLDVVSAADIDEMMRY